MKLQPKRCASVELQANRASTDCARRWRNQATWVRDGPALMMGQRRDRRLHGDLRTTSSARSHRLQERLSWDVYVAGRVNGVRHLCLRRAVPRCAGSRGEESSREEASRTAKTTEIWRRSSIRHGQARSDPAGKTFSRCASGAARFRTFSPWGCTRTSAAGRR